MKYGVFFKPPYATKRGVYHRDDYVVITVITDEYTSLEGSDPESIMEFWRSYWNRSERLMRIQSRGTIYRIDKKLGPGIDSDFGRFYAKYPWWREEVSEAFGDIVYHGKDLKTPGSAGTLKVPMQTCNFLSVYEYAKENGMQYAFIHEEFPKRSYHYIEVK